MAAQERAMPNTERRRIQRRRADEKKGWLVESSPEDPKAEHMKKPPAIRRAHFQLQVHQSADTQVRFARHGGRRRVSVPVAQ